MATITVTSYYLVTLLDDIILVDSTGGPITITMPAVHILGTRFTFKDKEGTSGTNNITIVSADGDLIDGLSSFTLSTPRQAVILHSTGSDWAVF